MKADSINDFEGDFLTISMVDLGKMIEQALRDYNDARHRDPWLLLHSPFAESSLLTTFLLAEDSATMEAKRQGVEMLLRWLIEKQKPISKYDPKQKPWRLYLVLYQPYFEDVTFDALAREFGLKSDNYVYQIRRDAIQQVAKTLRYVLENREALIEARNFFLRRMYEVCPISQQQLLNILAMFTEPLPTAGLYQLFEAEQIVAIRQQLERLIELGLIQQEGNSQMVSVHPELRAQLAIVALPQQRRRGHEIAAKYYQRNHNYLQAARHWRHAGEPNQAAKLLTEHFQALVEAGHSKALQTLFNQFSSYELDELVWTQLKIVAGKTAMLVEDVQTALAEYSQALGSSDVLQKAQAWYLRGKALQTINLQKTLFNYDQGIISLKEHLDNYDQSIELLEDLPKEAMLVDLYLGKAWIFIQERPNLLQAEALIRAAEAIVPPGDYGRQVDLHNAWAGLYWQKENAESALIHYHQAYLSSLETQNSELIIMTAHNLGQAYFRAGDYQQGMDYIEEARQRAKDIGDQQKEAKCYQAMGAGFFFQELYDEAATHYKLACDIYKKVGNKNWLGFAYYDLAEAYGKMGKKKQMRRYFNQAMEIAQELSLTQLKQLLSELGDTYPELIFNLTSRQLAAVEYARQHGHITNRQYREEIDVAPRTAARLLGELVSLDILERVGKGRSVRYLLKEFPTAA